MTHLRWQKLFCGQSRDSRRKSVRLTLELLEHRLTPAVFNAVDADMLIADIHTANNNQQANTINLTGFYLLYGPENPTNGANALPEITSPFPLTINGNPAVIEGNGLSAFRFFDVASGAALSLNNVALIGGRAEGAGVAAEGGAIFNAGTLTLSQDVIEANQTVGTSGASGSGTDGAPGQGGAIYNAPGASLTMTACTLSSNSAEGGNGGNGSEDVNGGSGGAAVGSGVFNDVGSVIITGCTLLDNHAHAGKGGKGGDGIPGTNPKIGPSIGGAGGVALGGGIANEGGTVTILNSTISGNEADAGNGGSGGKATQNLSDASPGGNGGAAEGGGLASLGGTMTILNSTFSANAAKGGFGGDGGATTTGGFGSGGNGGNGGTALGGGIASVGGGGAVTISNATVSGNTTIAGKGGDGGAASSFGTGPGGNGGNGGIAQGGGVLNSAVSVSSNGTVSMTVVSSTIAGRNEVVAGVGGLGGDSPHGPNGADGNPGAAIGGGISGVTAVAVENTIVAGNLRQPPGTIILFNSDVSDFFTDNGHNFIGDGDGSPFVSRNGDQVGTSLIALDPMLGPLQNNGGPTQTMMPLVGSPVIDAGDNTGAPSTDQRGLPRVVNGLGGTTPLIDIGAVEYQPPDVSLAGHLRSTAVAPGKNITFTFIVTSSGDSPALNVNLSVPLPANTSFQSFVGTLTGWTISTPTVGSGGTVTASIASLDPVPPASFTLVLQVNSSTPVGTPLTETATLTTSSPDPTSTDNSVTGTVIVGDPGPQYLPTPTLVSPSGSIFTAHPTFTWNPVPGADYYRLWVKDATTGQSPWLDVSPIFGTSYVPSQALIPGHSYRWWLTAFSNDGATSPWSSPMDFTFTLLDTPVLIEPVGPITSTLPTFRWKPVAGADYYTIWVNDVTTGQTKILYADNVTGTSWMAAALLTVGDSYQWWLLANNNNQDTSLWSDPATLTVIVGTPTLLAPSGDVQNATPVFSWGAAANAASYNVEVDDVSTGQSPVLYAENITGTSWPTPDNSPLTPGDQYRWWVRGVASNKVKGDWSAGTDFTVQPLAMPVPLAPVGPIEDPMPPFSWSAVAGADYYDVWVDDLTTGASPVLRNQHVMGTSWPSPITLTVGDTYQWWVRAYRNNQDDSPWGGPATFTVSVGTPTAINPSGTLQDATPTFTWTTAANAAKYEVWVNDNTAGQLPLLDQIVTGTAWTPAKPLPVGDSYVWWVRGVAANNVTGDWSSATAFTVQPLAQPVLIAPLGPITSTMPTFSWKPVSGTDYYEVWVDDITTGTSQVLYNPNVSATSWTPGTSLTAGHHYRWWVKAHSNNQDSSPWSEPGDFNLL
jgi:uncharacterized repeat protein (TIGR01451 family)